MFDLVFVLDPSLKSTSAQNESCRSFNPLQLLFWPNFMLPYEIWSFSGSNWSQNHSNESTVRAPAFPLWRSPAIPPPVLVGAASTRRQSRRSSTSERCSYPRGRPRTFLPRPVLPFHPHPRARAELGRAESPPSAAPATARRPASICRTRAAQPRRPPTLTTHERGRAPTRPKSRTRPPSTIEAPPLSSTTTFRPSSAPNRPPVS